jgi:rod shape-determining protein MreC
MMESRQRTVPLLVVMCVGHVLLISAQVQSREGVSLVEATGFGVFAGIQQATAAVSDAGRNIWSHYFALSGTARENEDLRRRLVELQGDIQLERARAARTDVLEDTLSLKRTTLPRTLAARVIAGSPDASMDITIDVGTDDGVTPDMAVIATAGVVGRVVQAGADFSRVQLLVSSNAAAHAWVQRSPAEGSGPGGMVQGRDDESLTMSFVPNLSTVAPGDLVLTSGQDGIYPQGLVIGSVETAEPLPDYQLITVRPAVDFSHIEIVLVILSGPSGPPRTP